jgi:hypothetical protein
MKAQGVPVRLGEIYHGNAETAIFVSGGCGYRPDTVPT